MGFELKTLVVIGICYTVSCRSNYHTITTTTAPCGVCFILTADEYVQVFFLYLIDLFTSQNMYFHLHMLGSLLVLNDLI